MSEQVPPFDTLPKIKSFLDDVSLGHSQSIYDTCDYDELKNQVLENLREVFTKAEKLDSIEDYCENTLVATDSFPNWCKPSREVATKILSIINQGEKT